MRLRERFAAFFQKKVWSPLLQQLKMGTTPTTLSLSVATGLVLSVFPVWGSTVILCLIVGKIFKLNHVAMQIANQLLTFLQLILIPVFMRLGEKIFRLDPHSFSPATMVQELKADPTLFFKSYGGGIAVACVAWSITAPFLIFILYRSFLPVFRKIASPRKVPS
jgi:uncharacterized protein (DUF2062 family)